MLPRLAPCHTNYRSLEKTRKCAPSGFAFLVNELYFWGSMVKMATVSIWR